MKEIFTRHNPAHQTHQYNQQAHHISLQNSDNRYIDNIEKNRYNENIDLSNIKLNIDNYYN